MPDTLKRIAAEEWEAYENGKVVEKLCGEWIRTINVVIADALIAKLVAAVEERDWMLRWLFDNCTQFTGGNYFGHVNGFDGWFSDLQANAARAARDREEGKDV